MRHLGKLLSVVLLVILLVYMVPASPEFPGQIPDSVQSFEPADVETEYRRSYYTNLTRQEVMGWYNNQFSFKPFVTLNLNYPPENSFELIRDQARSTYLEELVHPLRDSIYINGYEPTEDKDALSYEGIPYTGKVTVKYVQTSLVNRLVLSILTVAALYFLVKEYIYELKNIKKLWS